ncbi:MAG: aminotransferase class I/II-fold pyridoxal phosphate-dependent enzyme [Pseudomonadales bacterium]|nr:aminotransferase class I/II-fold pyridoxal phosphate-dependent enzyme [Pseudomonadales bacterium]
MSVRQKYAKRLANIQPFKVMKLLARANELEAMGRPIVHMEVGEPDFVTPQPVLEAGIRAIREGRTKYTPAAGLYELRQKISTFYLSDYGVEVAPERIFITAGGSGALLLAAALTINSGEGLLMSDPGYPCNRHFLSSFGAEAQLVPVSSTDGYQLTADLIRQNWCQTTRGVMLASPANPTGAILLPDALTEIIDYVGQQNGHVIVDEIYHGLFYSNAASTSALEISDQVVVVNSFSKYFGMTGWRLGWLVVPEDAADSVDKLAQNLFICASSIAQYAALEAFTETARQEMETNRFEFEVRRDFLVKNLRELGFEIPLEPQGAFYVYAKLPANIINSEDFCSRLLEEFNVAITPGTDFGYFEADRHVRFSYARNLQVLRSGIDNIRQALKVLV